MILFMKLCIKGKMPLDPPGRQTLLFRGAVDKHGKPDFAEVITRAGKGSLPDDVAAADELRASTSRDSKNDLKSIVLPVICQ